MKKHITSIVLLITLFSFGQKSEYKYALQLVEDKNYAEANELFEKLLNKEFGSLTKETHFNILISVANSYEQVKNYNACYEKWGQTIAFLRENHIHEDEIEGIAEYMKSIKNKINQDNFSNSEVTKINNTSSNTNSENEVTSTKTTDKNTVNQNTASDNSNLQADKKGLAAETIPTNISSSDKTVSITVSGSGKTQDDAKQSAFRSAIEQAFGTFISSKTEILNDQVVADQIASVANGNIQSFSILNESQLPDGSWGVTLKALVSLSKLTSFVEAKGIAIEIKGGMFALNIKQQLLNEQGEIKAVNEMVGLLHEPMQISFDYVIKSSDPKSLDAESKNWEIPLVVTATTNKNIDFCANYCINTLAALSLSVHEVTSYQSLNKAVFPVVITYLGFAKTFYLRKQSSINALNTLTSQWEFYTRLFTVQSGMDESNGNGEVEIHDFTKTLNYDNKDKTINFLTSGQQAATFSWQDKRTLAQIEQMTGYTVKPRGVVSQFKHGGFVVYEENGHGLVVAIADIGNMDWNSAKNACDELVLNGYSDWYLPSKEELSTLYLNFKQSGVGGFKYIKGALYHYFYWSSSTIENSAWMQCFDSDKRNKSFLTSINNVRAVRAF